jgi:ribokinase
MTGDTASVAVVGSYNVGLTMIVPRFPVGGETVIGRDFAEGPGGKGSNQAIAAARLGAAAAFIGKIGSDRYGDDAIELWESENVDADYVGRTEGVHTGVGFVVVNEDGENEITVAPGANDALDPGTIRSASGAIERSDCLLAQLEVPDDPLITATDIGADADVPVILNPAPARELPDSLLENVTYLTPNESEALILTGREPDADVDHETLARDLIELGVDTVVLTRGASGALLVTDDELTTVGAPTVPVTDTTGAGDAFNGALAVALGEGRSVEAAVRFACRAGALAVTEKEVIPGLPRRGDVAELADEHAGTD